MIDVTAAIIKRDGNILIAKRSSNSSLPNKWEFPGGKVDGGETPEECLARELYEEFDSIVTVGNFLIESVYQYEHKTIRVMAFQVFTDADITTMNAHDEVKWVPMEALLDYDLAPADVPIAKEVQKRER
jgi:8-oxo-dGTP diphosphatase